MPQLLSKRRGSGYNGCIIVDSISPTAGIAAELELVRFECLRIPILPCRLLASVRVPNADYGGTTCSEDELLAVKDSFSDAKRAFIDQQIVAGFSKALRGNTDARAIFKNHGANRALAGAYAHSCTGIPSILCCSHCA